ncbi:MAG TPA: hypothetical protein PKD09_17865 [Aggregatilinea sp.]|uniref:hypothetical protein n=1 Tax=Aggregatilinea sp. TaxID=2806333 RepID=UPI002BD3616A|nr:hypothetical protein [Aggregatilinea sp.]HML23528.1 hypothetical protein [Aggregatilinea sp.]
MDVLTKIIDSNIPWSVAVVALAWILRPMLTDLVQGWLDDRRQKTKIEQERNDNEKAQTKTMEQLGTQLQLSLTTQRQIAELIAALSLMPTQLEKAVQQMAEKSGERDVKLAQHTIALDAIRADVGDGEGQAWAEGGPRLAAIQDLLTGALASIEERIVRRLDPSRPDARAIVREELQGVIDQLNLARRLEQLGTELQQLKQGTAPPNGGDNQSSDVKTPNGAEEKST